MAQVRGFTGAILRQRRAALRDDALVARVAQAEAKAFRRFLAGLQDPV